MTGDGPCELIYLHLGPWLMNCLGKVRRWLVRVSCPFWKRCSRVLKSLKFFWLEPWIRKDYLVFLWGAFVSPLKLLARVWNLCKPSDSWLLLSLLVFPMAVSPWNLGLLSKTSDHIMASSLCFITRESKFNKIKVYWLPFVSQQISDGFFAHFYAICEHVSPVLAWGFLGPRNSLYDLCCFFKVCSAIESLF